MRQYARFHSRHNRLKGDPAAGQIMRCRQRFHVWRSQGMLSRALSLATVTLLIGCLTAGVARAAENLDAGKSASQIFSDTCSACHKSPRGLLKSRVGFIVAGFSAPALYDRHRHGLGTLVLPDIERGCRPPVSEQGSAEEGRQAGRKAGSARQVRSPPAAGSTSAGGFPAGRRRSTIARRGRASRPRREAARTAAHAARCRQACRWTGPGAGRDRQQIRRQA